MTQQLPAIIVIAPLVISFLIFFSGLWYKRIAYPLAVTAMSICLLASVGILQSVIVEGTISYWLGGWQPPWGIEYRIDHLNAVMLVLVSVLGLLAAVQANGSVARELPEKTTLFWSLYILMITGLLGICITGDLFNLFVLLEVASIAGYALISMGEKGALYAGFRQAISFQNGVGRICLHFYWVEYKDGPFPLTWMATGCICLRAICRQCSGSAFSDQSDGLCHFSPDLHRL
jgi:multicomponent Na+:H+ antiporter subunit D